MKRASDVAVIGGGVAGLTAAALLARAGARVTVYEHHNVPGGCASFYRRDGYHFDVGATVVNGFGERGIHRRVFRHLGVEIDAQRLDVAMAVHLPDRTVTRYGDERWLRERAAVFGSDAERFWAVQESIADRVWDFSARLPCLPVDAASIKHLISIFRPIHAPLLALQGRSVSSIMPHDAPEALRAFVDLQLLITAQSDASEADLTFGAAALDIAREGTYHLPGGISDIATALARAVRRHGGSIRYNTDVTRIVTNGKRVAALELSDGTLVQVGHVVAAVPIENLWRLLGETRRDDRRVQRYGAVTAYVGLPPSVVPDELTLHHQLLERYDEPLGEANSTFVSFSGPNDRVRARNGGRAVTISTHTDPALWENAANAGTLGNLRQRYEQRMMRALERVTGRVAPDVFELGTPYTFERYTGRARGLVGGVPQSVSSAALRARSHRTTFANMTLCGDTVFPGQSTVGVTLSALNAVRPLGAALDGS